MQNANIVKNFRKSIKALSRKSIENLAVA